MTTERQYPSPPTEPVGAPGGRPGVLPDQEAQERADLAEDRRQQQELDYGELGGEA